MSAERHPLLAVVDIEWTGRDWRLIIVFEDNSWQFVNGPRFATEAEARGAVVLARPRLERLYSRMLT